MVTKNYKKLFRYPCVTAQIAADLFENKDKARSVLLHMSTFDTVIGQISG